MLAPTPFAALTKAGMAEADAADLMKILPLVVESVSDAVDAIAWMVRQGTAYRNEVGMLAAGTRAAVGQMYAAPLMALEKRASDGDVSVGEVVDVLESAAKSRAQDLAKEIAVLCAAGMPWGDGATAVSLLATLTNDVEQAVAALARIISAGRAADADANLLRELIEQRAPGHSWPLVALAASGGASSDAVLESLAESGMSLYAAMGVSWTVA